MGDIVKNDLKYKDDYSWKAISGDDPKKKAADADRFSRQEGYEVLSVLNSLVKINTGERISIDIAHTCEWMIREKLPSDIQGRQAVIKWLTDNYFDLQPKRPF